jgi:cell division septum initiation protein DivIVA
MNMKAAGESVRHLAKAYKAVLDLGEYLERVGDLENAEAEAKARLEGVRVELGFARSELDTVNGQLADVKAQAEAFTSAAKAEAEQAVDLANRTAESIVNDARAHAATVIADATAHAGRVGNEIEAATARLGEIEQRILVRQAEHDRITREIEALRARIG